MAKQHWLDAIASDLRSRMETMVPEIGAGLQDSVPFGGQPKQPEAPDLQAFLQATPQERQAFLASIPPEDYARVTMDLMSEANKRFGAAASVLQPLFEGDNAASSMQALAAQGQSPNAGVTAAQASLASMLGIDPTQHPQ